MRLGTRSEAFAARERSQSLARPGDELRPSSRELVTAALFEPFRAGCERGLHALDRCYCALSAIPDSNRQQLARKTVCAAALELCEAGLIRPSKWALEFSPDGFADRRRFGGDGEEW